MQQEGMSHDNFTFVQVTNAYAGLGALKNSRLVHEHLIQSGCKSDIFVGTSLVDMYAKCGSIVQMLGEFSTRCHLEMWSLGPP
jgi:hypothetical protein